MLSQRPKIRRLLGWKWKNCTILSQKTHLSYSGSTLLSCRSLSNSSSGTKIIRGLFQAESVLITGDIRRIENDYIFGNQIGIGTFGTVRIGMLKTNPSIRHAIKSISKQNVIDADMLRREIKLLQELQHPNIIGCVGVYEGVHQLHIVTELCTGGELFDRIIENGCLSEHSAAIFTAQALEALRYCHEKNVIHRDIKPENIMFRTHADNSPLCLVDFGCSFTRLGNEKIRGVVGSPSYIAPEVVSGNYDEKIDIFSMGAVCYAMLTGSTPYNVSEQGKRRRLENQSKGCFGYEDEEWNGVSHSGLDFVNMLMQVDPSNRLSADEALRHPWITNAGLHSTEALSDSLLNLKSFKSKKRLKQLALGFIAQQQVRNGSQATKELIAVFHGLDKSHSGRLSIQTLVKAMAQHLNADGTLPKSSHSLLYEFENCIQAADVDGSGDIDINEFVAAGLQQALCVKESWIHRAFDQFDLNGDGVIDINELRKVTNIESLDAVKQILEEADRNGDGRIDFAEFSLVMRDKEREYNSITANL